MPRRRQSCRRSRRASCASESSRTRCRATSRSSWTATAGGPRSRGLPRVAGHGEGVKAVREHRAGRGRARHRVPHPLRVLLGELEPAPPRGVDADEPARALDRSRAARADGAQRALPRHRPPERRARAKCSERIDHVVADDRAATRASRSSWRSTTAARDELVDAVRRLAREVQAGRARAGGHRRGARGAARSTPTASPTPICSSARAARCACRTSSCGRSPTRSCG